MLSRPETLSALMRAGCRGDAIAYRQALDAMARWLRKVVARALVRAGRSQQDTEDIVQETLLAIHLKRHTWDDGQPIEPWARAIAHYKLVDALRRRGFRDHLPIDDFTEILADPGTADPNSRIDATDLVSSLDGRQQLIVRGIAVEGKSPREIGDQLGLKEGAVRVALHRALKSLAKTYRREEP